MSESIRREIGDRDLRSYAAELAARQKEAVKMQIPVPDLGKAPELKEIPAEKPVHKTITEEAPVQKVTEPEVPVQKVAEPEVPVQKVTEPEIPVQKVAEPEAPVQETVEPEVPVQEAAEPEVPVQEAAEPEVPVQEATEPEAPVQEAQAQPKIDPMSYVRYGLDEKEKSMLGFWSSIRGVNEQVNEAVTLMMRSILADKTSSHGNVLLIGDAGNGRTTLALGIAKIIGRCKGMQSQKVAKIYAEDLNSKDIAATVNKIAGGILIIEEAGDLSDNAAAQLSMAMDFKTDGLIVFLEDERRYLMDLLGRNPQFAQKFDITMNVPTLTNDELVEFGKYYALQNDSVMDDSAVLTLYDGIGTLQNSEQPVAILDVKEIMDKAIKKANKFSLGKLFSTVSGKRYDSEDRIIIKGKYFGKIK